MQRRGPAHQLLLPKGRCHFLGVRAAKQQRHFGPPSLSLTPLLSHHNIISTWQGCCNLPMPCMQGTHVKFLAAGVERVGVPQGEAGPPRSKL